MRWLFLNPSCVFQVSSLLAREDDNTSPGENESNTDETEVEEPPVQGGEGACASDTCDAKQADQVYIETLEPIKFDTAELVVRIVHN